MSTINKIRSVTDQIGDKIRIVIFYLGVHLTHPIKLLGLIYISGFVIWRILSSDDSTFKMPAVIFAVAVTIPFFAYVIHLMFPPSKRVEILVDAYGNNPRIIPFIAKKVKRWLEEIIKFMEKQPNIGYIRKATESAKGNRLEELHKKILKPRSTKKLMGRIEKKGNYLNALISGVSESFQIPRESIEELINSKVDINQKIVSEINISYDQIKDYLRSLSDTNELTPKEITGYYNRKIKERLDYLESKKESLNTQIEWIEEFDKRKKDTLEQLLEILKEPSTGKAVSKLSRLLSLEKVKTKEDLIWIIRFANSRKGFNISELLGIKIMKGVENETLNWYESAISKEKFKKLKKFTDEFVRLRSDALGVLWKKFKEWNEITNKLDFNQPIAIGLTYGYSSALRRILQGLCKDVMYLFSINAALVEENLNKGDITKELKNEFKTKGFPLSENATIRKREEKADKWEIINGEKIYTLRKEDGKLNIYDVENIGLLSIILIKGSEAPGEEEILKAELMADYPGLKCVIMPIEVIEKKEIQRRIGVIFVGIESINKQGDIVHPRGGSEIIRKIKEYRKDTEVYAFGESYKVQGFTEDDIDYTKLSLFRNENIHYVVTDHGVHKRVWYLFSWDSIPGADNEKLIRFLKDDFDIEWAESAKIRKSDNTTISISTNEKSAEIKMDEKKEKAILKISDGRTHDLKIKTESDKLNIYREENKWKLEKVVDKLLFSWDSVPGADDKKLIRFLKDDFDIEWAESAEIRKSDNTTISISTNEKSAEIKMDEKKEKAILKISDGRTHDLKIKTENDKLNIYKAKIVEEALKDNLDCCAQHWKDVSGI